MNPVRETVTLRPAIFALRVLEVGEPVDGAVEAREQPARPRPLEREHRPLLRDLLDPDVVAAPDQVGEVREVGLRGREHEVVLAVPQEHAVLDEEPAVVAPDGVLGVAGLEDARVTGEHAGEERLRAGAGEPVLEQRRRVEHARGVPDGEVLELLGEAVLLRCQVARTSGSTGRTR